MFKLWAKVVKNNKTIDDIIIENDNSELNRTRKSFQGLEDACYEYNLAKPIWLDSNISSFKKHSRTRFTQDNFIETIDFDYLEIEVIEDD